MVHRCGSPFGFRSPGWRMDSQRSWRPRVALMVCLMVVSLLGMQEVSSAEPGDGMRRPVENTTFWNSLIAQAEALGLPTKFLSLIQSNRLSIEFEDLRSYAAEYHPEDHRMVLNRTLSLNHAGGVLVPLDQLTNHELGTVYHEFFHAFLNMVSRKEGSGNLPVPIEHFVSFAKAQQQCRYQHVLITPIVQRKTFTEERFLTERESWEALHETWAVFVGWGVWTILELDAGRQHGAEKKFSQQWVERMTEARQAGALIGYYEPEEPEERALTHKRYLAPSHGISYSEVKALLIVIFEESPELAEKHAKALISGSLGKKLPLSCPDGASASF